jgi:hypothetical protein
MTDWAIEVRGSGDDRSCKWLMDVLESYGFKVVDWCSWSHPDGLTMELYPVDRVHYREDWMKVD